MPSKDLAKALHTLTSATNVAEYVARKEKHQSGPELARATLMVLNPGYDYTTTELARIQKGKREGIIPLLIARIVDACDQILAK